MRLGIARGDRGSQVTHWTPAPVRLNRDLGRKRWGDEGYALEELVAELGSAFLCADHAGDSRGPRQLVENWLKVLKDNKRAAFTAASHATKAVDFLHGLQPQHACATDTECRCSVTSASDVYAVARAASQCQHA
jgi:antirestriction protein ArdC